MADKEEKPLGDLSDDELMDEIKKVVGVDKITKIGRKSPIIETALELKNKRSRN